MRVFSYQRKPWGAMLTLFDAQRLWLKIIRVKKDEATSLQTHENRSELHMRLPAGPIRLYSKQCRHRMGGGVYVELAWGNCDERDIMRFEDKYGRV